MKNADKYQAVILAAGVGSRLGKYSKDRPKCMLPFLETPIIERQIGAMRSCGLSQIALVGGYLHSNIPDYRVSKFVNHEFASTNMVVTLMCARNFFEATQSDLIVAYGDIIYEPRVLEAVIGSSAAINVTVDDDYLEYWRARGEDWQNDLESLTYDANERLVDLGEPRCSLERARSRYLGLIRFSAGIKSEVVRIYDRLAAQLFNSPNPWRRSKSFRQAYMTCFLQELIDNGIEIKVTRIRRGWLEFDTADDLDNAERWYAEGSLSRFINL